MYVCEKEREKDRERGQVFGHHRIIAVQEINFFLSFVHDAAMLYCCYSCSSIALIAFSSGAYLSLVFSHLFCFLHILLSSFYSILLLLLSSTRTSARQHTTATTSHDTLSKCRPTSGQRHALPTSPSSSSFCQHNSCHHNSCRHTL